MRAQEIDVARLIAGHFGGDDLEDEDEEADPDFEPGDADDDLDPQELVRAAAA